MYLRGIETREAHVVHHAVELWLMYLRGIETFGCSFDFLFFVVVANVPKRNRDWNFFCIFIIPFMVANVPKRNRDSLDCSEV